MRRKIYDKLLKWKQERNGDTALLIEGARRIGKSYTAEEFAHNEYYGKALAYMNGIFERVMEPFATTL